jgi:chromate transporter
MLAAIGVVAAILSFLGLSPLLVLALAGITSALPTLLKTARTETSSMILLSAAPFGIASPVPVTLFGLFLSFVKIGAIVLGSGYVLLAFLRAEFINRLHWLTEKQLIDAVAVGQFTPGPVFTTATFIGYLLAGIRGASVATVGIFLPGFLLVAASGPLI